MGFNKVYKTLQEIFPQIDARALRAVAIEHSKDADAAVEAVLVEVIPFFTERSRPNTPSSGSSAVGESSRVAIATSQSADYTSVNAAAGSNDVQNGYIANAGVQQSVGDVNGGHINPLYDAYAGYREAEITMSGSAVKNSMQLETDARSHDEDLYLTNTDRVNALQTEVETDARSHDEDLYLTNTDRVNALQTEVSVEPKADTITSDGKYPESGIQLGSDDACNALGASEGKDDGIEKDMNILREGAENGCLGIQFDTATQGQSSEDGKTCVAGPGSFVVHDVTASIPENSSLLLALHEKSGNELEELDASLPSNSASKMESVSNIGDTDDVSTLNGSMSQSSKLHMIDALANIIADARDNKKMLYSAMDSVYSLMREVELKEKDAEQAKMDAATGGTDILVKTEEIKRMVKLAEETNSMHAGEVYGEKAILATELRELQSRALSLSVERDKYLDVLSEMQEALELRLAEAQHVIRSVVLEKVEKENAAMKALTEQDLIMEKFLEESNILNQQAEDNAKLRKFLVDRGHVVDTLQGEISVICQDVRALKEKFDECVPLSKSLTSSQTSFILASSSSSSKSLIPEQQLPESIPKEGADDSTETQLKKGVSSFSTGSSSQDEVARDDHKVPSDDEWEIFERDVNFGA